MSILAEKIFKPRKVLLKEKVDLIDFYAKVKVVLNDHKIFVSNKIFANQWDKCQQNNGNIKVMCINETKMLYSLDFMLTKGVKEKVVFLIDTQKRKDKKIQLIYINSKKTKYQYLQTAYQDSVFLDKQKPKELEY